jgi:hypothetical protein
MAMPSLWENPLLTTFGLANVKNLPTNPKEQIEGKKSKFKGKRKKKLLLVLLVRIWV